MNAILINRYGDPDVLEHRKLSTPLIESGEVLVKVTASSINPIDFKVRQGGLKLMLRKPFPLVLGHDFSGEVVGLGKSVSSIKIGQKVFGMNPFPGMGAYAGYLAVKENYLAPAPQNIGLEEAASIPLAALTALQGLRDFGKLKKGQDVLINGASGGVGTFAVQLGKILGANVTGVCSGKNAETVRSLGADLVIDYHQQSFEKLPDKYDLVFDAVGKSTYLKSRPVLKSKGNYVTTLPSPVAFLWKGLTTFTPQSAGTMWVKPTTEDLKALQGYIDTGSLRPVIEKIYKHDQIKEAMRQAETNRTVGKLVVRMDFPDTDQG